MTAGSSDLVVHAQPHRSRYRLRDHVKCQVSLHSVKSLQSSSSMSVAPSSTSTKPVGGEAAAKMAPFVPSRLFADATRVSTSQLSLPSSVVHVHDCSVQLVAYCCWDRTKLFITEEGLRGGHMPVVPEARDSHSSPMAEATKRQLQSPEVLGRNESVTVLHLSTVAKPFEETKLHLGETSTAAIVFVLPPLVGLRNGYNMMPSYRGHSLRTVFMVVVSVTWSSSFTSGGSSSESTTAPRTTKTTSLRFPLRVHAPEAVLPGRLALAPLFSSDDDDDDILSHGGSGGHAACPLDDDGSWVSIPSTSSPALCPPLHDALVQEAPSAMPLVASGTATAAAGGGGVNGSTTSNGGEGGAAALFAASSSSLDAQLRQGIWATTSCCGPTDYIIRCQGVHAMNFLLESTVVTLGGCLCGTFVAVPSTQLRVARITLSINSIELVGKPFVAKGAYVTSTMPDVLSGTYAHSMLPERVAVQTHVVEEREWYVPDAQHMPLEVCITPIKFQQTIRTPLASLEWVARWRFWCVDTLHPGQINVQRRPLKEVYQELELPITICPPTEGAVAARMGQVTIGM